MNPPNDQPNACFACDDERDLIRVYNEFYCEPCYSHLYTPITIACFADTHIVGPGWEVEILPIKFHYVATEHMRETVIADAIDNFLDEHLDHHLAAAAEMKP